MRRPLIPSRAAILATVALTALASDSSAQVQNFDDAGQSRHTAFHADFGSNPAVPTVTPGGPWGNFLRLATTPAVNINTIAFDLASAPASQVVIDFDFRMTAPGARDTAADGIGVAFASAAVYGASGAIPASLPDTASLAKSVGVGFQTWGTNLVSVTYDNVRLVAVNVSSQLDLVTGAFIHAKIIIDAGSVPANVTVVLTPAGGAPITVVDRLAVPGLAPYAGRAWLGARSGGLSAHHDVDNLSVSYTTSAPAPFIHYLRSSSARMVSYSPTNFNPNRVTAGGPLLQKPTAASITQDLQVLRQGFDGLILYGTQTDLLDNGQPLAAWIVREARRLGFRGVMLGVWDPTDTNELDAAAALAIEHGTTANFALALCIGNEGILRGDYGIGELDSARARVAGVLGGRPVPIVTSEDLARYSLVPALRAWGDFLFPIIVPHWNVPQLGPAAAAAWVREQGFQLAQQAGLSVVVKEAGWPSGGAPGYTPETQRQFIAAYVDGPRIVESLTVPGVFAAFTTILEAFDQPWKQAPDFTTWGLLDVNRAPKPAFVPLVEEGALGQLVWQQDSTGQIVTWHMGEPDGSSLLNWQWVTADHWADWRVVATGDFNRDGHVDLVWQHPTTRHLIVWYMRGKMRWRWKWLVRADLPGWRLASAADLNRDGHVDLVWQHDGTRRVSVWYLGGVDGDEYLDWIYVSSDGVPQWSVVGTADMNRDGTPDLLWQNDLTRQATTWYLGGPLGASYLGWAWLAAEGPAGWHLAGASDLDGDSSPDLVWQHDDTRQATVWYLSGSGGTTFKSWRWLSSDGHALWKLLVR